jgi:hypothetical protein
LRESDLDFSVLVQKLWSYRRRILIVVAAIMGVFVASLLVAHFVLPSERTSSMTFRLLFDGAQNNKYPNGSPFSVNEIVEAPVLTKVYEHDDLKQYLAYKDFKDSIFVLNSNPALDLLTLEYQAKLTDTKIAAPERSRIEAEFRAKADQLQDPVFRLAYRRKEGTNRIPDTLQGKVFGDILSEWAQQAVNKGAVSYLIPVYSRNIAKKEFIDALDYAIAADVLRTKVTAALANIETIQALPGATVVRAGKDHISLAEVAVNLNDLLRFKIQPLMGLIRANGLSKNPVALGLYYDDQLRQLQRQKDEIGSRVKAIQESWLQYSQRGGSVVGASGSSQSRATGPLDSPAMIPQFDASFLDKIIAMGNQNSDVAFRQTLTERVISEGIQVARLDSEIAYYRDLAKAMQPRNGSQQVAEQIKTASQNALDDLLTALDDANAIYSDVSAHNLNPNTLLYTITGPFNAITVSALSLRSIGMYAVLMLVLSLVLVPGAFLGYDYFLSNVKRPRGPSSTAS